MNSFFDMPDLYSANSYSTILGNLGCGLTTISFFDTGLGVVETYSLAGRYKEVMRIGTAGTLSSGNTLDCLMSLRMSSCSLEPGTTGESGEMMALASRKFILPYWLGLYDIIL